jgi:glycerol-3-phosphate cytidylyltransferase
MYLFFFVYGKKNTSLLMGSNARVTVGYTTGTYDMLHRGHIALLQTARRMCDALVVGLTTDELAVRQKRKTMMPWVDRKAVLECLWMVDNVVAHDGDSKLTAWRKLQFDVLFIGDDYFGATEYTSFDAVPVIYIPRTPCVSSSHLLQRQLVHLLTTQRNCATQATMTLGSVMIKFLQDDADGRKEVNLTAKCSALFLGTSSVYINETNYIQLLLCNKQSLPNLKEWLGENPDRSAQAHSWVEAEERKHSRLGVVVRDALVDLNNILADPVRKRVHLLHYGQAYATNELHSPECDT